MKGYRHYLGVSDCSWGVDSTHDSTCGRAYGSGKSTWVLGELELQRVAFLRSYRGVVINCKFWNVRTRRGLKLALHYVILWLLLQTPPFRKLRSNQRKMLALVYLD